MPPQIATILFGIGIAGLFILNRDRKAPTSKALWLAVVWLSIATSRPVSQWMAAFGLGDMEQSQDSAELQLDGSPLDRNVFIALLTLGVVVLIRRKRNVGKLVRVNSALLVFFFYCAVSVIWSDYPDVAFKRWIKALGDLVMVLIVVTDPEPTTAMKRLLSRVGFVMVPLSVLFIKYYPDLGREYARFEYTPFYSGVTMGKNLLGMTCLITGLGAVWCFLQVLGGRDGKRASGPLLAQAAIISMVLWLFWMANSMTSLSCFLMGTGLILATNLRAIIRRPSVVQFLVAAMLTVSFSALFLDIGGGVLSTMGRNTTLTGRTEIWSLVLAMTGNPMVGTGFESFWLGERLQKMWSLYWWHPNEAHDGYLEVFLNLGWIGVIIFGVLLLTGYRNVFNSFRRDPNTGRLKLAYFLVAVAYNFTESAIRTLNPVWIVFLLATVAVPNNSDPENRNALGYRDTFAESEPQDKRLQGGWAAALECPVAPPR